MDAEGFGQRNGTKVVRDPRVEALLSVSRTVAEGAALNVTLDSIAGHLCALVQAQAVSILRFVEGRFRIVGSRGLTSDYRRRLDDWPRPLVAGRGPAGLVLRRRAPVLVEDVAHSNVFAGYEELAEREKYRSLASFPLRSQQDILGTLTIYRTSPGPWTTEDVELLAIFADHAASAVLTADLIAEQRRQVHALERLVTRLREQTHEYANRLHAIGGLLRLGEPDEAFRFVQELANAHTADRAVFEGGQSDHPLVGLLWVDTVLARQRSITLECESLDGLARLPLTGAQSVTIVGNLLDNAFDAVGKMPDDRRRVRVTLTDDGQYVRITVRDWGAGFEQSGDPFRAGYSTKPDHAGLGLTAVIETVRAAGGRVDVERHQDGLGIVVTLTVPATQTNPRVARPALN